VGGGVSISLDRLLLLIPVLVVFVVCDNKYDEDDRKSLSFVVELGDLVDSEALRSFDGNMLKLKDSLLGVYSIPTQKTKAIFFSLNFNKFKIAKRP
jgi:hypothetical protein